MDTIIDFIRHGEPVGGRRYRGHGINDPLSDKGWRQMWAAVPNPVPWSAVISSPMQRCFPFANAVANRFDLPIRVEERFKEIGFGEWEGLTPETVKQNNLPAYNAFYEDPVNRRPENAESLEGFCRRVASAFDELIRSCEGEHLVVVAHAGVIRGALRYVMRWPADAWYRIRVDNGAMTRFRGGGKGLQLEFHNLIR